MYKTIIMPVDVFEMELSDKAVRHAEFLAQDDGVIHLLHVLPGSASLSLHRFAADVRRFEEHLQHEAQERLQTMVSHFTIDPSRIKQHVRFGSVRDEVNELAEELGADVVVIGSRNPSISTHLLGSNATPICRCWLCVNCQNKYPALPGAIPAGLFNAIKKPPGLTPAAKQLQVNLTSSYAVLVRIR